MMKKGVVLAVVACFMPALAQAVTFEDILANKASASRPYWGEHYQYENIRWISHMPYFEGLTDEEMAELEQEALQGALDERGQIDIGAVDFNRDGVDEYLKVIWTAYGGFARGLILEVYKDKELTDKIVSIRPQDDGYYPNFQIADIDLDGSLEIITFAGVPDPNMSARAGDGKPFEPRFVKRFLKVSVYKYQEGAFHLHSQHVTNEKFAPHDVVLERFLFD